MSVGLVGAGPWAATVHAPMLAEGPETRLAGVWSRRPEAAAALARAHQVAAFARYDDLIEESEVVAFAVPPHVQPDLAVAAARAGRALLLEKPLALDLAGAERIAAAVEDAGVISMLVLTLRFSTAVREFIARAQALSPTAGRGCYLSGAFLGGPYAQGWRLEHGALLDVGPHILDLLDAALGPVVGVEAHGDPLAWVGLLLEHQGGAHSEVSLTCRAPIDPSRVEVEVFGPQGTLAIDARAATDRSAFALLRAELATAVRKSQPHPLDAARGLHLQQTIAAAQGQLVARNSS